MDDGVVGCVSEIGIGAWFEEVSQNRAELARRPSPGFFRRLLRGLAVDGDVAVAFLAVLINHFRTDNIDHLPARLPGLAHITSGEFLADVIRQPRDVRNRNSTRLLDERQPGINGRRRGRDSLWRWR